MHLSDFVLHTTAFGNAVLRQSRCSQLAEGRFSPTDQAGNIVFRSILATADGLNPFTISQNAKTISCKPMGMFNKVLTDSILKSWVYEPRTVAASPMTVPRTPQPDNHRGMSFDLYSIT